MATLIAPVVPNLPVTKAAVFGALAGVLGVAAMAIVGASGLPDAVIVAVGDAMKGVLLGAALAMTERMTTGREHHRPLECRGNPRACCWGTSPSSSAAVGKRTSLSMRAHPSHLVAATIQLREGKVILDDRVACRTTTLKGGQRIALGNVQVVVDSGTGDRDGPARMPTNQRTER